MERSIFRSSIRVIRRLAATRRWSLIAAITFAIIAGGGPLLQRVAMGDEPTLQEKAQRFLQLQQEVARLFAEKKYAAAADVCREQMGLVPESPEPAYNLACALARLGQPHEAMEALGKAVASGFSEAAHLRSDEDLASLHADPGFDALAKKARENASHAQHEAAGEIEGVKTVEAFPEDGLRYRLRMSPNATREKPDRLIIWLHPSGGSMDRVVERMSPELVKRGFALIVFTQKQYATWTSEDVNAVGRTLQDVAKVPGIDANRPLLMGFSAGGQAALQMWAAKPAAYGALIVDAAYPLDMQKYARGQVALMALPEDDRIKKVPIYALVGGADGGAKLWQQAAPAWKAAGVPLTIRVVEGKGHAWLVDEAEMKPLQQWLEDVAAGKAPGG